MGDTGFRVMPSPNPHYFARAERSELLLPTADTHSIRDNALVHAEHEILIFLYVKAAAMAARILPRSLSFRATDLLGQVETGMTSLQQRRLSPLFELLSLGATSEARSRADLLFTIH